MNLNRVTQPQTPKRQRPSSRTQVPHSTEPRVKKCLLTIPRLSLLTSQRKASVPHIPLDSVLPYLIENCIGFESMLDDIKLYEESIKLFTQENSKIDSILSQNKRLLNDYKKNLDPKDTFHIESLDAQIKTIKDKVLFHKLQANGYLVELSSRFPQEFSTENLYGNTFDYFDSHYDFPSSTQTSTGPQIPYSQISSFLCSNVIGFQKLIWKAGLLQSTFIELSKQQLKLQKKLKKVKYKLELLATPSGYIASLKLSILYQTTKLLHQKDRLNSYLHILRTRFPNQSF